MKRPSFAFLSLSLSPFFSLPSVHTLGVYVLQGGSSEIRGIKIRIDDSANPPTNTRTSKQWRAIEVVFPLVREYVPSEAIIRRDPSLTIYISLIEMHAVCVDVRLVIA